jgi:hypothetical protein
LETGVDALHYFCPDGFMVSNGNFRVSPYFLSGIVSSSGLQNFVRFAGHEPLECFHVLGYVRKNSLPGFLLKVLEVCADGLGLVLLLEGLDKTGLPSLLCPFQTHPVLPPRYGAASEDPCQFLDIASIIAGGNHGGNLKSFNESPSSSGVLGLIGVEQWRVSGPLEMVT